MGRLIAIGDIHGCNDELVRLIDTLELKSDDKLVFLGDYIDRGPNIFETIKTLIKIKEEYPQTVCLMGNHERMFLDFLSPNCTRDQEGMFLYNGGLETIDSYRANGFESQVGKIDFIDLPESHQVFYDELELFHEDGDFLFVHAGVHPDFDIDKQTDHDMLWIRGSFLERRELKIKDKLIVHGHTPMDLKQHEEYNSLYDNKINLDTGAVFGYYLTACDVRTGTFTRIKSKGRGK